MAGCTSSTYRTTTLACPASRPKLECPAAYQSSGRLPGRAVPKDGRMHKQHLQDNNLGMPCRYIYIPADQLCIKWEHPVALQMPCLWVSGRSGRRRCWPGCVKETLQRRCVLPVAEPSQVLAISEHRGPCCAPCCPQRVLKWCMPPDPRVVLAARKQSAMKHCCRVKHAAGLVAAPCMAGSTLQQLTRAVSSRCFIPAHHCFLVHSCASSCPDCLAALASAPAVDGLHVAHRWLAEMIVHLSLDVKPYSSVKQVGQLCTSRQHTDVGSAFRSCRLWPSGCSLPQWSNLTIKMIGVCRASLVHTVPAVECWQSCIPYREGLCMSVFSSTLAAVQSPYPDLQQLAGSDDSDTFFRNAVAVMPHFARSVAAQLRQASDRVGEPACSC